MSFRSSPWMPPKPPVSGPPENNAAGTAARTTHPQNAGRDRRVHPHDPVRRHRLRVHARPHPVSAVGRPDPSRDGADRRCRLPGRHHGHPVTPHKATKKAPLTPQQRQQSRELASTRLRVEHVIRCMKIFRVLKDIYRHRRRRFSLRVNLIAAVCSRTVASVA